jgi:transcriptional regulator with XRE-family HTH domain
MTTRNDLSPVRDQAVALRTAGKSLREIREALGPISNQTLNEALRGTPPPDWTRRPRAKDDLRAQARELRAQGLSYKQIADQLGVSKSSVSLWVRDLPRPPHLSIEESRKRSLAALSRYWQQEYASRREFREEFRAVAAREIGELTERETLIAGAVAYWCEGAKTKPYRQTGALVSFINSDPGLVLLFLRFLDTAGIQRTELIFRVSIHESAGVEAAQRFWAELTEAPADQFRKPTLKRHNPKTIRKNTGEGYYGCLTINVRRSGDFYRKIEGWVSAITASPASSAT